MDTNLVPQFFNKPTAAVHIQNGYTATERKLVNICLYEGVKFNFSKELYDINVWETLSLIGCDKSKNSAWLKNELFESLRKKPIRWNILKKDRGLQEWTCSFLAGYVEEPEEGKLAFQFNPMVVKHFKERRLYSRLLLQIQAPIKSGHALTLYEFLNDELHRNKTDAKSITLSLSDLRTLLDIGENQYKEFKYFNDQAVKPAFIEVNKHTDLHATYRNIREGRRVIALGITAKRRKNFQLAFNLFPSPLDHQSELNAPEPDAHAPQDEAVRLLQAHGITKGKACELLQKNSASGIVANLKYSLEQQKQQKVKHFPSYLVKAIEDNYAQVSAADQKNQLNNAWTAYRRKQVKNRFEALPKDRQASLRQAFEASMANDPEARITKQKFDYDGGWGSQWVQHQFINQLLTTLLETPQETDFDAFVEWWPQEEIKIFLAETENRVKK